MIFIFFVIFPIFLNSQILPSVTDYNQDIVWESEFKKISKYRSFFEYNKDSFNNIIKEVFYD